VCSGRLYWRPKTAFYSDRSPDSRRVTWQNERVSCSVLLFLHQPRGLEAHQAAWCCHHYSVRCGILCPALISQWCGAFWRWEKVRERCVSLLQPPEVSLRSLRHAPSRPLKDRLDSSGVLQSNAEVYRTDSQDYCLCKGWNELEQYLIDSSCTWARPLEHETHIRRSHPWLGHNPRSDTL